MLACPASTNRAAGDQQPSFDKQTQQENSLEMAVSDQVEDLSCFSN